jgi:lysophospholipase L1-like esterase
MRKIVGNTVGTTLNPEKVAEIVSLKGNNGSSMWAATVEHDANIRETTVNKTDILIDEDREIQLNDLILYTDGKVGKVVEVLDDVLTTSYTGTNLKGADVYSASNIFKGKTASFYGDSLTEVNGHYTKGYHSWLQDKLGFKSYNNYGVSGYKISDVYNRVKNINDTADIIFVMCGVNDQTFSVPLGTLGDTTTATSYGALDLLCSTLKTKYPTKLIVFITPHYQTKYPHSNGITSYEVSRAVKEVCEKYAIPIYDNFILSGIYSTNLSYWTTDGCHWNNKAHEMVGKNIANYMLNQFSYVVSNAVEPTIELTSITATFNQGTQVIYNTDTLDKLKAYLTVTANYSDGSKQTVTNYTLSGTLTVGNSTITVSYSGKTTTFTVVVTEYIEPEEPEEPSVTLESITADFNQGENAVYTTDSLDSLKQYLIVTAHYSDNTNQAITDYTLSGELVEGNSTITVTYKDKTTTFIVAVSVMEGNRLLEITGNSSFGFHLTNYVTAEELPVANGELVFGYDIEPIEGIDVFQTIGSSGTHPLTADKINDLIAGFTEHVGTSKLSGVVTITDNQNGIYSVSMTGSFDNLTANRAYWVFPMMINCLRVGAKIKVINPYVKIGDTNYEVCAVGGAFKEESCIVTDV